MERDGEEEKGRWRGEEKEIEGEGENGELETRTHKSMTLLNSLWFKKNTLVTMGSYK